MTGQPIMECRFCERDDLTPQGHKSHETHCDENPNPGISYQQQKELGILDEDSRKEEATPDDHPNPDQGVSAESSDRLPDVESLSPNKNGGGPTTEPVTDGGEPSECPICGGDDVTEAKEAKADYLGAVENPHPKAVLAYELADWTCRAPECAALWGEEYHEPLTMEEVVNA